MPQSGLRNPFDSYVPFDDQSGVLVLPVNKHVRVNRTAVDDVSMTVLGAPDNAPDAPRTGIPIDPRASTLDRGAWIPATLWFSGFSVFTVSYTDGIEWLGDISHFEAVDFYFSCTGYAQDRTFVIDGKLISIKGRSARSHNLAKYLAPVWSLDFAWGNSTPGECCSW